MRHSTHRTLLALACVAFPGALMAEVSDKEPTVVFFWQIGLVASLLGLVAARFRPWLGVICFTPIAVWFAGLFLEMHSTDVGAYLRGEQGNLYYLQAYAAFALAISGFIAGYLWHRRKTS